MSAMAADLGSGPIMRRTEDVPLTASHMFKANRHKTMHATHANEHVNSSLYNLQFDRPKKGDPDYLWHSHATTFARNGVQHQGSCYVRDPLSGAWFKDAPGRRREYHHSGSNLTMKISESHERIGKNGAEGVTHSLWAAPCPPGSMQKVASTRPRGVPTGQPADTMIPNPLTRSMSLPTVSMGSSGGRRGIDRTGRF